jgi:arylsulfatase A-like enzyme
LKRITLTVISIIVLSSLGGCGFTREPVRLNVILISLDTLRADHVGCYGYHRNTTPVIDAVAEKGTVFEQVIADSPWTLPSHASMLTGLQPRHHGVRSHKTGLPETIPTLATALATDGFHTMALVNSKNLSPKFGLHRGFQQFRFFRERVDGKRVRSGKVQVDLAIEWLKKARDRQFFLFLHNYDIHSPYDPSPRFARDFTHSYTGTITGTTDELMRVRKGKLKLSPDDLQHIVDLYDAGISELDHELGRLFDFLNEAGLLDRTILIVTSDHGEEFLEHGGVLHGRAMHRELLEVPLIFSGPGVPQGGRVGQLAQLSDIFTTVLEMVGLEAGQPRDGTSLVNAWSKDRGDAPSRRAYAEADHNREIGDDTLEMVQTDEYKFVFERPTTASWLYNYLVDPGEQVDVSSRHPELVGAFLDDLESLYEGRRSGVPLPALSESDIEALRALGYVN